MASLLGITGDVNDNRLGQIADGHSDRRRGNQPIGVDDRIIKGIRSRKSRIRMISELTAVLENRNHPMCSRGCREDRQWLSIWISIVCGHVDRGIVNPIFGDNKLIGVRQQAVIDGVNRTREICIGIRQKNMGEVPPCGDHVLLPIVVQIANRPSVVV